MKIVSIIFALFFLVLMVWLIKKLNAYSKKKYSYLPINIGTIFLAVIPYSLLIVAWVLKATDFNTMIITFILAIIFIVGIFLRILQNSSFLVAMGAIILLLITGLPALLIFTFSGRKDLF